MERDIDVIKITREMKKNIHIKEDMDKTTHSRDSGSPLFSYVED